MILPCVLLLSVLTQNLDAYPFRAAQKYATMDPPDPADQRHIYPTSGVHHYPIDGETCEIPGCLYDRGPGEPSDPFWPQWWMSNWTMYVIAGGLTDANPPPWSAPPSGYQPADIQVSTGWSVYDSSWNEGQGAMIEYYDKQCLQIFPLQLNWSCAFMSLGDTAYFLRYDDRPAGTPECCLFSKLNHPARRDFVQHLPYNATESGHLNDTLQAYSVRPGGILFGYSFYKDYTQDSYDPTQTYRHPHSFYFAGIGRFFDPLTVSQNYKDFRAQQPDPSFWALKDEKCSGQIEYCCLFDTDCPNDPPPVPPAEICPTMTLEEARAKLIDQLTTAAQLEQSLMISYLYAAASLKVGPEEFSGERKYYQYELVRAWKRIILQIAREEMGHLHYANALLVAVGGVPAYGIPDFPHNLTGVGDNNTNLVVSLSTFDFDTMANFVRFESSDVFLSLNRSEQQTVIDRVIDQVLMVRHDQLGLTDDHQQVIIDEVNDLRKTWPAGLTPTLATTVADFYSEIRLLINCYPSVINETTKKVRYGSRQDTDTYTKQDAYEQAEDIENEIGDENSDIGGSVRITPETKRKLFSFVIPNATIATEVIDEILQEGEGGGFLVNKSDLFMWLHYSRPLELSSVLDTTSHLFLFLRILGEYQLEVLFDPNFKPSRGLVTNPQINATCPNSATVEASYALNFPELKPNVTFLPCPNFDQATLASSMVDIFNRMYHVLTLWLQQAYIHQGPENDLLAAESLMFWLYMSDVIRPTLEVITALPLSGSTRVSGAFQPTYRAGIHKGVVVLQNMTGLQNDSAIVQAFADNYRQIRAYQRDQLHQVNLDLVKLESLVVAAAPLYKKIYEQLVYNTRIMVDEIDARTCYGILEGANSQMHPNMTAVYPPWNVEEDERSVTCTQAGGSDVVFNSVFEERPECTIYGGSTNSRLVQLHFRGWFQVRMATDPDPPNEFAGVTGNAFAYSNEPKLDRAIYFQAKDGVAPVRSLDCLPYTPFGVDVTEISAHNFPSAKLINFGNFTSVQALPVDDKLTAILNQKLQNCKVNLLAVGPELPVFKSDNYLIGLASEGIDPFHLSLSCDGVELARRPVSGPLFQDMSPGQRQFSGRYSQDIKLNINVTDKNMTLLFELEKQIGFAHPRPAWRIYRERQKLLQLALAETLPVDPADPYQLILIGRILDSFLPMPALLVTADNFALDAIKSLKDLNQTVFAHGSCQLSDTLQQLRNLTTLAYQNAHDCPDKDYQCAGFFKPDNKTDLTSLTNLAQQLCANPSQSPAAYVDAVQKLEHYLDFMVPQGACMLDIRFMRFLFDAFYQHSISGNLTDLKLTSLFSEAGLKPVWQNRLPKNEPKACYDGVNSRWGINYDMEFFDTDLMWGWVEGDLWIPAEPLTKANRGSTAKAGTASVLLSLVVLLVAIIF